MTGTLSSFVVKLENQIAVPFSSPTKHGRKTINIRHGNTLKSIPVVLSPFPAVYIFLMSVLSPISILIIAAIILTETLSAIKDCHLLLGSLIGQVYLP